MKGIMLTNWSLYATLRTILSSVFTNFDSRVAEFSRTGC